MISAANRIVMELRSITKRYERTEVLQNLSLEIRQGQITAIVGANGSGKSTLLRILAGLTAVSSGSRRLASPSAEPPLIGYAPDRLPRLRFTAREYLTHMAAMAGLDRTTSGEAIEAWMERFHLNAGKIQMKNFSKGMLQKVNLIQAVMRQPDLLLLDEPYGGLDPDTRDDLASLIREERDRGAAIVVASHDHEWARRSADRIVTIAGGSIVADELVTRTRLRMRDIVCLLPDESLSERLLALDGVVQGSREGKRYRIKVQARCSDALLSELLALGASILLVGEEGTEEVPA